VPGAATTNGTQLQLMDRTGQSNQRFTYTSSRQLQVYAAKCLDANGQGTSNGTTVIIWDCNGQSNQQWTLNSNGTFTGVQSGLCLDANTAGTANGTEIILWSCNGGGNQQWSLRSRPGDAGAAARANEPLPPRRPLNFGAVPEPRPRRQCGQPVAMAKTCMTLPGSTPSLTLGSCR
jgi:ricin-type beta-trefoil lectin protein